MVQRIMHINPEVSVILPVYNAQDYIEDAINSILKQTFTNFELIVINDGSTDHSLSIIKSLATSDSRIRLVSRENKGLIYSLNEAISLSKGELIARMDADDICYPNRLAKQVDYLKANPDIDVLGTWARVFQDTKTLGYIKHPTVHDEMKTRLIFSVCFCHPTVMFRRRVLSLSSDAYNPDMTNCEDYALWVDLVDKFKFATIPEVLLDYRYLETSISRTSDSDCMYNKRMISLTRISEMMLENIGMRFSEKSRNIHFILSSNERIKTYKMDAFEVTKHLFSIYKRNVKFKHFKKIYLFKFLTKKFVLVILAKFK